MKQKQCGKKIIFVAAAVILCVFAGLFLLQRKEPSTKGQGDKIYRSLSKDDRQVADVYATLYETDKEEVARIQKKTNDWEKTNKQLEKEFFTIDENIKYEMQKEGYRLEDLEKAEKLSVQTGKKAMELIRAKGKASDKRKWSDVVKKEELQAAEKTEVPK
jgi:uncharacterized membrane protein YhiD involved in acid resistance